MRFGRLRKLRTSWLRGRHVAKTLGKGAPVRNFQMTASTNSRWPLSLLHPIWPGGLEANMQLVQTEPRSMHSVSKAASIKKASMNRASRAYPTRVAPQAAAVVRPPLRFEQRLDDCPLLTVQVHIRPVRPVERTRL
jgi:hypothetical protein